VEQWEMINKVGFGRVSWWSDLLQRISWFIEHMLDKDYLSAELYVSSDKDKRKRYKIIWQRRCTEGEKELTATTDEEATSELVGWLVDNGR